VLRITPSKVCWRRTVIRRSAIGSIVLLLTAIATFTVLDRLFPFPLQRLETWPVHPIVTDRTGKVLLQRVGSDEQWRQPVPLSEISPWLPLAMVAAEDERFRWHRGVDPLAIGRAALQNVQSGGIRSGASTLTMQICRMIDDQPRSWRAKICEAFRAIQLERLHTKDQILADHLNLAPFGGNLRGVEAASQAYFGKPARDLSLGDSALLAGLPQAPTRYRPDLRPEAARHRREYVLRRMVELRMITPAQREIAGAEPLPDQLQPRLRFAPHAAQLALTRRPNGGRTTLDLELQQEVERLVGEQRSSWPARADASVVIIDVATGEIRALVGSASPDDPIDGQVNGALARRSPGSALKPFLYAAAFEARELGPDSTIHDGPIARDGWTPDNFDQTFSGDVTVAEALRRSLNVPAILATEQAGLPRCLGLLESVGISLPAASLGRGGLAVAVGALEVSLLDLTNGYATLARGGMCRRTHLLMDESPPASHDGSRAVDANVCAALDDILSSRRRAPQGMELISPTARPGSCGRPVPVREGAMPGPSATIAVSPSAFGWDISLDKGTRGSSAARRRNHCWSNSSHWPLFQHLARRSTRVMQTWRDYSETHPPINPGPSA